MQLVGEVRALRAAVSGWHKAGDRVALVPTMGALHAGHQSLVEQARGLADRTIVSIFVNPRQFGPSEDLNRYPRRETEDRAMLASLGIDLIFAPSVATMYPPGFATKMAVANLGDGFEGAVRPGHFDGVAIVVAKLLIMAAPDVGVFGEKDWQQLAIIRQMAGDLDLPVEIRSGAIVRDADGLALSSRNIYLSPQERTAALALPHALQRAAQAIGQGAPVAPALRAASEALLAAGFAKVDYFSLVDERSLQPLETARQGARLLAAATMGSTRLLDNLPVEMQP
jgi:pantoate--beta-alanine ligase